MIWVLSWRKYILKKVFTVYLALLWSCQVSDFSEPVTANYELNAIDTKDDMSLCAVDGNGYVFEVIHATVFSVGYNDDFIIVKQHPKKKKVKQTDI